MHSGIFRPFTLFSMMILLLSSSAKALVPVSKAFELKIDSYKPRIQKILRDHYGTLWIGTDRGVFKFDGIGFQQVPAGDTSSGTVSALYEDNLYQIWIGYEDGHIATIEKNVFKFDFIPNKVSGTAISAFAQDTEGKLFFTTKGNGVFYYDNGQIHNINLADGMSDNYCYSAILLPDGRLCVGTDRGLNFIRIQKEKKEITSFSSLNGLPDNIVRTLSLDHWNNLWIGMQDKGVCKLNFTSDNFEITEKSLDWTHGQVNGLLPLENEVWLATEEEGIQIEDSTGNTNPLIFTDSKIRLSKVNDITMDLEQNVWIASGNLLIRSSGEKLRFLYGSPSLAFTSIHCVLADRKGNIWFSPDQQLIKASPSPEGNFTYQKFIVTTGKHLTDIVALYEDIYGFIWIGTMGEGVFRLNPTNGTIKKVHGQDNLDNSSILSINGSRDDIWITGFNGAVKFRIEERGESDNAILVCTSTPEIDTLTNNYVYAVLPDKKGRVWMGTDEQGLAMIKDRKIHFFTKKDGLPSNTIHSISEGMDGNIWLATSDAGISVYDGTKFKNYSIANGLSDDSPISIQCDKSGNICIVHANGIDILNPATEKILYHGPEEGLEELTPDPNSISQDRNGNIWIGTRAGLLVYRPFAFQLWPQPSIRITGISVFLQEIDPSLQRNFEYDENNIRFDFSSTWYSDPEKIQYAYLLEGYTTKWQETKDRSVIFPKLPPGNYRFRVRSSLNEIEKDTQEANYSLVIHAPVWQRWWFRSVVFILASIIFYLLIRRREERLRKVDRLQKEKIQFQFETLRSQVNPHFLFNSFNTLITVIEENPVKAVEYVERLSEFFRNIVTYRDRDLIPLDEELTLLENYIFIQRKRYGDSLMMNIHLDPGTRQNFQIPPLTLQLLAENAIKHNSVSKETPLVIDLFVSNEMLFVRNNINPKIQKEKSTGLGLQNIINRYKLLTSLPVKVDHATDHFTVALPLLTENKL
ncbi:MAG TPA: two-component regulator propeller domain-containing protein [Bacteroidia bacterium]|nr:two-component regulator propeller domain-containing protein [Bacteroidia bacterium]